MQIKTDNHEALYQTALPQWALSHPTTYKLNNPVKIVLSAAGMGMLIPTTWIPATAQSNFGIAQWET